MKIKLKRIKVWRWVCRWEQQGNWIPRGYGIAVIDHCRARALVVPMPLNVAVRAAWLVYCWMLCPFRQPRCEKEMTQ